MDGELLVSNLVRAGYEQTFDVECADLIIINSCGFIESAKKESLEALLGARKKFQDKKIILAGCLAQRYAKDLEESLPEADGVFGNGDLDKIAAFAKKVLHSKKDGSGKNDGGVAPLVLTPPQKGISCGERLTFLNYKNSAYVKITEGCSNHCSFCAIPLIRGELRSRPADDIVLEIKSLLKRGVFEINLIGQDLAAYGTGKNDLDFKKKSSAAKEHSALYGLLKKISALKGKFWVRLLYIHPDHFNADILELMKNDDRLLPYFDIPFQSGDEGVILSMNRKNTPDYYAGLVENIRAQFAAASIRTTFLTGFPGESDEAAENTLSFLKRIQPDWSGCFPYSKEEDTPAYSMKKQVAKKTVAARAARLQAEQEKITSDRLRLRVGKKTAKEYDVLIEEVISADENGNSFAIGRGWFQAPEVDGNFVVQFDAEDEKAVKALVPGSLVRVRALAVSGVDIDSVYIEK